MDIKLFNYQLPRDLIANSPTEPRDHSRLMIIDRKANSISHDNFYNLPNFLTKNDVLVFNNSKVFPARLFCTKSTGGKIELLLLNNISGSVWSVLYKGKLKIGDDLKVEGVNLVVISIENGTAQIEIQVDPKDQMDLIYKIGHTPIPPYIKPDTNENDLREKYQTVYAKVEGSVAAPTAGFHFTKSLLTDVENKGVQIEYVTLHVGLGTFTPLKEKYLEEHKMHSEYFDIDNLTIHRLNEAKKAGKRIISVGTTATRVLETLADTNGQLVNSKNLKETNIFIYPPYKFKFVDRLITNFHLPKSTLLALVCAFVSSPNTPEKFISFDQSLMGTAYKKAIENNYRFYSFGDTSLIL